MEESISAGWIALGTSGKHAQIEVPMCRRRRACISLRSHGCRGTQCYSKVMLLAVTTAWLRVSTPETLPECPGFGTDADEQLCSLWRESVASIPYEVLLCIHTWMFVVYTFISAIHTFHPQNIPVLPL